MGVLEHLEPKSVFHFFEEICRIPHGSGNIRQISDYLKQFAADRGLECIQDELYNIIIIKEAAAGYEQEEPVILQGHMDMVAVAKAGSGIDMKKEPLRLYVENGMVRAQDTSLGGDDGIAVAYALALLDAQDISHPRLEVVLTVDEEIGMDGAKGIDLSMLRGRRLINLDQEDEGVIITSCAGGARVDVTIPLRRETEAEEDVQQLIIKVSGLQGGHSGVEINKGRGNANCLLGNILRSLSERFTVRVADMEGGLADNAIPREAEAVLVVKSSEAEAIAAFVEEEENRIKETLGKNDPDVSIDKLYYDGRVFGSCYTVASTKQAFDCLNRLPNGVITMSREVEGLVQTSLNLGVVTLEHGRLQLSYAVRSSVDEEKEQLCRQMQEIAERMGASASVRNSYTGWAYRKDSPLRDSVAAVYERMYGQKPVFEAIHAGLECGILASKIEGLDCVSIGPDMADVHTAQESLDIASVRRTWEFLLEVLKNR